MAEISYPLHILLLGEGEECGSLEQILRAAGHHVTLCPEADAVARVTENAYDLALVRDVEAVRGDLLEADPDLDIAPLCPGRSDQALDLVHRRQREMAQQCDLRRERIYADVGRTAGRLAHDLNNKLAVIIGNAQLAEAELKDNEPVDEEVQEILTESVNAREFTTLLRSFSPKRASNREVLAPGHLLEEIEAWVKAEFDIPVKTSIAAEAAELRIRGDAALLLLAIQHLCTNACEAMEGNDGEIRLEVGAGAPDPRLLRGLALPRVTWCELSVSDTGPGMDAKTADRAGEFFFTTRTGHHGLGLGLARFAAETNNGFLALDSAPGRGTRAALFLPCADPNGS